MKLLFFILFSVFSIESALADFKICHNFFYSKKSELNKFVSNLVSSRPLGRGEVIAKMLETQQEQEPEKTEDFLLRAFSKVKEPSIKGAIIDSLLLVNESKLTNKTQSTLVKILKSKRTDSVVNQHVMDTLNKLQNYSDEVYRAIFQMILTHIRWNLQFFDNKEDKRFIESFKKLLLLKYQQFKIIPTLEIKKVLETQKPTVAEDIFLEVLYSFTHSIKSLELFDTFYLTELFKALEKATNGNFSDQTQLTLVKIFNFSVIGLSLREHILKSLINLEKKPLDEVFYLMEQILEERFSYYDSEKKMAEEFFEKHSNLSFFQIEK